MKRDKVINRALSIFFTILSLAWIYPVFMIALNSFKKATAISTTTAFDLLTPETSTALQTTCTPLTSRALPRHLCTRSSSRSRRSC